jgi:DNA-binding MarR family transcriptional regulator
MSRDPSDSDYQRLLAFRDQLRRFLHWSEQQAVDAGITPAQYQLLLAVRGHVGGAPTIRDVAEHLLLRHHSVVGLIDRAELAGLVERRTDSGNHRVVRLHLTRRGTRRLATLAAAHLDELKRLGRNTRTETGPDAASWAFVSVGPELEPNDLAAGF